MSRHGARVRAINIIHPQVGGVDRTDRNELLRRGFVCRVPSREIIGKWSPGRPARRPVSAFGHRLMVHHLTGGTMLVSVRTIVAGDIRSSFEHAETSVTVNSSNALVSVQETAIAVTLIVSTGKHNCSTTNARKVMSSRQRLL